MKRIKVVIGLFVLLFILTLASILVPTENTDAGSNQDIREYLVMKTYNPDNDTGYGYDNLVSNSVFGRTPYGQFSIASDKTFHVTEYQGFPAYGVNGSNASIHFKINYPAAREQEVGSSDWYLSGDTWTKSVCGAGSTGEVVSGALIVQTSSDGRSWSNTNMGKYTNGLHTTDYYRYYSTNDTVIYEPSANQLNDGVFLRVSYAFEVYHKTYTTHWLWGTRSETTFENYVITTQFYLLNENVAGITFHNDTLNNDAKEETTIGDGELEKLYSKYDTMRTGSMTTTGFKIVTDLLPNADITITRNWQKYDITNILHTPEGHSSDKAPYANSRYIQISEDGRYDIHISTKLGTSRDVTIYVDTADAEAAKTRYLGDETLNEDRLPFTGSMPVFMKDKVIVVNSVSDYVPGISCIVINTETEESDSYKYSRSGYEIAFPCEGEYCCIFSTDPQGGIAESGDTRQIVLRLVIFDGVYNPTQNYNNFIEYCNQGVSALRSSYYGVSFNSAAKGVITLAFSTFDEAYKYAYEQQRGSVESYESSWRYTGTMVVEQKKVYNDLWDLTDAMDYFAKQSVQKLYFDTTDMSSYLGIVLLEEDAGVNLRTLELMNSVTTFVSNDYRSMLLNGSPILSERQNAYLTKSVTGTYTEIISDPVSDFEFIKDDYGAESNTVTLSGDSIEPVALQYFEGVTGQLSALGLASGKYTITETSKSGGIRTYEFIYIKPGTIDAKIEATVLDENKDRTLIEIGSDNESDVHSDYFCFDSISDIWGTDGILKLIRNGASQEAEYYAFEEVHGIELKTAGSYEVEVVDMYCNSFSFKIIIDETYFVDIIIEDVSDENIIMTTHVGGTDIILPTPPSIKGFTTAGYVGSNASTFSDLIPVVDFNQDLTLRPSYIPKTASLYLIDDGKIYEKITLEYGESTVLPELVKDGYKFEYWVQGSTPVLDRFTLESEEDVSLTAILIKTRAKVTFFNTQTEQFTDVWYNIGETVVLPEVDEEGFNGWVLPDGGVITDELIITTMDDRVFITSFEGSSMPGNESDDNGIGFFDSPIKIVIVAIVVLAGIVIVLRRL